MEYIYIYIYVEVRIQIILDMQALVRKMFNNEIFRGLTVTKDDKYMFSFFN